MKNEQKKSGILLLTLYDSRSDRNGGDAYRSCMINTTYKVAPTEGELTNINKCIREDDGTMSKVLWYIVAPEIVIRAQIRLIMQEAD
jgi:hypothetical protein